jgi:hypothetical protein
MRLVDIPTMDDQFVEAHANPKTNGAQAAWRPCYPAKVLFP